MICEAGGSQSDDTRIDTNACSCSDGSHIDRTWCQKKEKKRMGLGGADVIALAWTDRELHGRQADKQLFSDERSESSSVNSSSSCP